MLNHISNLIFEISIGGKIRKAKSRLIILTFLKIKNGRKERGENDIFKTRKILKIGRILQEKIACKAKMVTLGDHLTATG